MSTGFDMTSMMVGSLGDAGDGGSSSDGASSDASAAEAAGENTQNADDEGRVGASKMITRMFSSIGSNDLASLKEYFDSGESNIDEYVNSIEYSYDVTPQIFDANTADGVRQINPDTSFSSLGMGAGVSSNSLMSMSMSTNVFSEMVGNTALVEEQYDVVAGHWPEKYNECVVVLTGGGNISDFMSYVLGLNDPAELQAMVKQFVNEEDVTVPENNDEFSYSDLLNVKMKLVSSADYYQYDEEYGVWVDKAADEAFMENLVNNGEDMVIAGIVQPKPEATAGALSMGVYYTPALTQHIIDKAADTRIVKDQLADSSVDVFSGKSFAEMEEEASEDGGFDMSSMFSIDEGAIQTAFTFDESALTAGLSGMSLDLSNVNVDMSALPAFDASSLNLDMSGVDMSQMSFDLSGLDLGMEDVQIDMAKLQAGMAQASQETAAGFAAWYTPDVQAQYPNRDEAMAIYMETPEAKAIVNKALEGAVDMSGMEEKLKEQLQTQIGGQMQQQILPALQKAIATALQTQLQTALAAYMQQALTVTMTQMASAIEAQVTAAMNQSMTQLSANMANAMSIDANAFANAFQFNMDEDELTELIMSMMTSEETSYDGNLAKLGYADTGKPAGIDLYPKDFESKQEVISILDAYNQRMQDEGQEDKAITYTDIVGTLMDSVTTIIDMISYVLIAFVAISLVVSSIMIGVITYISVLERKKEIGILRAIGASKGDVSRVFNAETIIEGLVAGLLGVGVTALFCIPASAIVYALFDVPNVASLPWQAAVVLVLISVVLTFIAGLMPASSASRKDPVEALRSE